MINWQDTISWEYLGSSPVQETATGLFSIALYITSREAPLWRACLLWCLKSASPTTESNTAVWGSDMLCGAILLPLCCWLSRLWHLLAATSAVPLVVEHVNLLGNFYFWYTMQCHCTASLLLIFLVTMPFGSYIHVPLARERTHVGHG